MSVGTYQGCVYRLFISGLIWHCYYVPYYGRFLTNLIRHGPIIIELSCDWIDLSVEGGFIKLVISFILAAPDLIQANFFHDRFDVALVLGVDGYYPAVVLSVNGDLWSQWQH